MFLKTVIRIAKLCWGMPIVLVALVFTGLMAFIAYFGTVLWEKIFPKRSNPFVHAPWVFLMVLRHVFFRWTCIRIYSENACKPFMPGDRVIAGGNHGSHISMFAAAWASAAYLPNPIRWVIKAEAMNWPYGRALKRIGLGWPIDRAVRDDAHTVLETMGRGFKAGTAEILIDGSRPTDAGIEAGKQFYRNMDRPDLASMLRFTCRPRAGGFRTILLTVPHERVVRVLVTSSVHEEGFWGLLDLMFEGAIFVRLEDWHEELDPGESRFVAQINYVWLWRVQEWISNKRLRWASRRSSR